MRYFHLGDVLSIATGKVLARGYVRGVYGIVSYMWQQPCDDGISYLAMYPECKLWLLRQHPHFGDVEMLGYISTLEEMLKRASGNEWDNKETVFCWVDQMIDRYGEQIPIKPILGSYSGEINRVEEAQLIMGPGRTITI